MRFLAGLLVLLIASAAEARDVCPPELPCIEAYANKASVLPGEQIAFKVREREVTGAVRDIPYTIYRVGDRAPADSVRRTGIVRVRHETVPPRVWVVGCNWPDTLVWTVPRDWPSGLYVAHFGNDDKHPSYVDFVVRARSPRARIVIQVPITTRQAYNHWGGGSLYGKPDGIERSHVVSFDRPDAGADDSVFLTEELIRWAEGSVGHAPYVIEYITSIDLHAIPKVLSPYQLFVTVGHDEYWTLEMRNALDAFVRAGGNAAIFSGNTSFWQARLGSSLAGGSHRALVSYKKDAAMDSVQGPTTTTNWFRDPVRYPENSTFGLSFRDPTILPDASFEPDAARVPLERGLVGGGAMGMEDETHDAYPFEVTDASSWVFEGTGLTNGSRFGQEIVGYETDALVFQKSTNRPTGQDGSPNSFQILAKADLTDWEIPGWAIFGLFDYGGTVFNASTTDWAAALTDDADFSTRSDKSEARDAHIVQITKNVFDHLSSRRSDIRRNTMTVHEYYADSPSGGLKFHFSTSPFVESGWKHNQAAFSAFRRAASYAVPVWQYYVAEGGGLRFHYSLNPSVSSGWTRDASPAFYAYRDAAVGLPVYEYYYRQPTGGVRFYYSTNSAVTSGWTLNGVAFYVPTSPEP